MEKSKTEMYARIAEINELLGPLVAEVQDIEAQLIQAKQDIKAGLEIDHEWRHRAYWAYRQKRKDAAILRAELKALNIATKSPGEIGAHNRKTKLDNRFADVFMNVAKESLPHETYVKLRQITRQRVLGEAGLDDED